MLNDVVQNLFVFFLCCWYSTAFNIKGDVEYLDEEAFYINSSFAHAVLSAEVMSSEISISCVEIVMDLKMLF